MDLDNISEKSSPLYNLLYVVNHFKENINYSNLKDILKKTYREFIEIDEEDVPYSKRELQEEYLIIVEDIIDNLASLEDALEKDKKEAISAIIQKLESLNQNFITTKRQIFAKKNPEEELIEEILRRIPKEDFITDKFEAIENLCNKILNHEIDAEEFCEELKIFLEFIKNIREEYEKTYISPEEWTIEVATGDKILIEGLHRLGKGTQLFTQTFKEAK